MDVILMESRTGQPRRIRGSHLPSGVNSIVEGIAVNDMFADDRWYGARYSESIGDTLHVVAGRILRDLTIDRDEELLPRNTALVVSVAGNTITVNVFVTPGTEENPTVNPEIIRTRVKVVAARYDWRGKENASDRRFFVRINVKTARASLHGLIDGALLG
jgi:hypothetical protein